MGQNTAILSVFAHKCVKNQRKKRYGLANIYFGGLLFQQRHTIFPRKARFISCKGETATTEVVLLSDKSVMENLLNITY